MDVKEIIKNKKTNSDPALALAEALRAIETAKKAMREEFETKFAERTAEMEDENERKIIVTYVDGKKGNSS